MIARSEAGATGSDHHPTEGIGEADQFLGNGGCPVGDDRVRHHRETVRCEQLDECSPAGVDPGAGDYTVADGEYLGEERWGRHGRLR